MHKEMMEGNVVRLRNTKYNTCTTMKDNNDAPKQKVCHHDGGEDMVVWHAWHKSTMEWGRQWFAMQKR
jgi:hypothetical protein